MRLRKGANCIYFKEESKLFFTETKGKLDHSITLSENRRTEGLFLDANILKKIESHAKSKSNTLDKYYPYQKELLEASDRLKQLVLEGYTVYWRRRPPIHSMELLALKHRS